MDMSESKQLGPDGAFPTTALLTNDILGPSSPSTYTSDGWELIKFHRTPKISSYLVAWANGHFERRGSSVNGVELGIYATHDNISQTEYALDLTKRVLPIYEMLFDITFPLGKLVSPRRLC